jgi:hypothetical protein
MLKIQRSQKTLATGLNASSGIAIPPFTSAKYSDLSRGVVLGLATTLALSETFVAPQA